jgi:hypothetical protein
MALGLIGFTLLRPRDLEGDRLASFTSPVIRGR